MNPEAGLRILLVDDEPGIRQGLGDLLRTKGHDVLTADSAEQALEQLRRHPRDLLITDLKMEGAGGLDLIRTAREIDTDLAAILVTGYVSLDVALEAIRLGIVDLIEKPFRARRVLEAVASCPRRRAARTRDDGTFSMPLDRAAPSAVAAHLGMLLGARGFRNPARAEVQTAVAQAVRTVLDSSPVTGSVRVGVEVATGEATVTLELPARGFEPGAKAQRLLHLLLDRIRPEEGENGLTLTLVRSIARVDPDVCRVHPEDAEQDLQDLRARVASSAAGLPVELDLSECEALSAEALLGLDEYVAQVRASGRDVEIVHAPVAVRRAAVALGLGSLAGPVARPEHLIRNTLWS